jgi:hypothetical protein
MSCPFAEECSLFEASVRREKMRYLLWAFCRAEYTDCVRYKMLKAGDHVPEGLMPTGDMSELPFERQSSKRIG